MEFTTVVSSEMLSYEAGLAGNSSLPLQQPQAVDVNHDVTEGSQLNKTEMRMDRIEGKIQCFFVFSLEFFPGFSCYV